MMAYRILILIIILTLNGFFAAAEVSLVSVRKSRLRSLANKGQVGAQAALNMLANPARLLSVTQVGVTLASLGLGWAGEDTIYELIIRMVHPVINPGTTWLFHSVGIIVAFLLISYAHVVVGEVVPKNLALEKADRLALLVAPVLLIFGRISAPFVFVAERSARSLSKLIGLSGEQSGGAHSPEELKFVVSLSQEQGNIRRFEEETILALLDLHQYSVREIMVPRNAIVSISIDANLDQMLRLMSANQFSRLPVYEKTPENIVGYLHFKDLLAIWEERRAAQEKRQLPRSFRVRRIMRRLPIVPETKVLADLIDEFRDTHRHMALVVDEFGSIAGLVTLEDIFEQIFGEIGDEHDAKRPAHRAETAVVELDGSTSIRDLDAQYAIELPGDAGFETLAGFILYELGNIPKEGDQVVHERRRFTVMSMERNRIATVRIEKIAQAPGPAAPKARAPVSPLQ